MRLYFKFGNYSNLDFGLYLAQPVIFSSPMALGEAVAIPGKDGTAWRPDNSYDDVTASATLFVPPEQMASLSTIRAWLMGEGNCEVEQSATCYYKARIASAPTIAARDFGNGYDISVSLTAAPFPYVKTPADITLTSAGTVDNDYLVAAWPTLTVDGSGDVEITVGAITFQLNDLVSGTPAVVYCDDPRECKIAGVLANDQMVGAFPSLVPGENAISWVGTVSSIVVSPNWRTL